MVNFKRIAEQANVSLSTVSRVMNSSGYVSEEKRVAVLNAAKELGLELPEEPIKKFVKKTKDIIGIVVSDINNPFYGEAIKGIMEVLKKKNINAVICDTDENSETEVQVLETLKRIKVGGIIITPATEVAEYNIEFLQEFNANDVPVVLLDRDLKLSDFDGVFLDSYKGAFEAVKSLIKNGHSQIAILTGLITSKPGIDRLKGYLEALRVNDLPINEEYIMYGDFREEKAYELTTKLLTTKKEITAIFSSNNLMSVGCFEAISDFGYKVPDDIAMFSFDDFYFFASRGFNISAVGRPTKQMGIEAAEILINRMENKKNKNSTSKRIILSPHLELRGSESYTKNK